MRTAVTTRTPAPRAYTERVNLAIDHVVGHLGEPLRLTDVARAARLSPFHFHRVFQVLVGETLAEFVKRLRLERALVMMAHAPRSSLTTIALTCGFSSSSDFSRCFKQRYGTAPSAFDLKGWREARGSELQAIVPEPAGRFHLGRLPAAHNPDGFRVRIRELPADQLPIGPPMSSARIFWLPLMLLLLAPANPVSAQTCFRGRPLPTCTRFWIVESGIGARLNRRSDGFGGAGTDILASLEFGVMRNRSPATALGGTAFLAAADQITGNTGVLLGLKPRVRRWIGRTLSVDLSPGGFYVLSGDANANTIGLTGHGGLNFGDWAALSVQVLVGRSPAQANGSTEVGFYLGGKLGSYPGAASGVAVPLAILVFSLLGGFRD